MPVLNCASRISKIVGLGILTAATLGCSGLKSGSDRAPAEIDARWACLQTGAVATLPTFTTVPPAVIYAVPIFDFANPVVPVPGLTVSVCRATDSVCPDTASIGQALGMKLTDVVLNGVPVKNVPIYAILVPFGIQVYLKLNAPGYLPQEYYFGGPLLGERLLEGQMTEFFDVPAIPPIIPAPTSLPIIHGQPLTPVRSEYADSLANQAGNVRNPEQGLLVVRTIDCDGNLASGVTLTLQSPAEGLYYALRNGLAISTEPPQTTDEGGLAGFANIPIMTGTSVFSITVAGTAPGGVDYGQAYFAVRPNHLTVGEIRPDWRAYGR